MAQYLSTDEIVSSEDTETSSNQLPVSEIVSSADSVDGGVIDMADIAKVEDDTTPLDVLKKGSKALAEDPEFDPTAFYLQNEALLGNQPEAIDTLAEVLKNKKLSIAGVAKAALTTGAEAIASAPRVAKKVAEAGMALGKQALLIRAMGLGASQEQPETKKALAELAGATELNTATYAKLGKGFLDKVGDLLAEDPLAPVLLGNTAREATPEEWRERLIAGAELTRSGMTAAEGEGAFAKWLGVTPEEVAKSGVKVDPQNIQDLSWVADPLILTAAGTGFKVTTAAGRTVAEATTQAAGRSFIETAKEGLKNIAGQSLIKTGKAATRAAEAMSSDAGRLASAAVGYGVGDASGLVGGVAAPGALRRAGGVLEAAGEIVTGARELPVGTRTVSKVLGSDLVKAPLRALNPLEHPTAAVLAAGGETEEEVGGVVGSVGAFAALGAAAGGAKKVAQAGADQLALKRFKEIDRAPVAPFDYGSDPVLDQQHKEGMSVLNQSDPKSANKLNYLRAALPTGAELYVLSPDQFSKQVGTALGVEGGTFSEPGFIHRQPDGSVRVYLNQNTVALGHEVGHAVEMLMPEADRAAFRRSITENYTPEQILEFGAFYDSLLTGESSQSQRMGVNQDRIVGEMAAEILSKAINSEALDGVAPSAATKAVNFLTRVAEDLGLYEPGVGKGPAEGGSVLGVKPSAKAAEVGLAGVKPNVGRLASQEVIAQGPTAPKKNLRVTPEEQAGLDVRQDVSGATEAEAALRANPALYSADAAKIFSDVNAALQRPQGEVAPLRLDYESVKDAGGGTEAQKRKIEQDDAYIKETLGALPQDIRELADKMTIPYRWTTRDEKNINLLAFSVDKMLANSRKIVEKVKGTAVEGEVPYSTADGKFTEEGWRQLMGDMQIYTRNQANGFAGDGSKITRPEGYAGVIPPENQTYRPTNLPRANADFLNAALALPPPKTARTPAGFKGRPVEAFPNVQAAALAEANLRPVIRPAATAKAGKEVYTQQGADVPIAETNPFRNKLAEAGIDLTGRNLFQAVEELNLQNIKSARSEPQSGFRAPSTDLGRAGFMPPPIERPERMPKRSGYYWLSPEGKVHPLDRENRTHGEFAFNHLGAKSRGQEAVNLAKEKGWVRLTNEAIDPDSPIYFEGKPNSKQKAALEALMLSQERDVVNEANGKTLIPAMRGPDEGGFMPNSDPKTQTPEFRKWFGKSKAVNDAGEPMDLYHGTTHDFSVFDSSIGNPENDLGRAIYLSSTPGDVAKNYAGTGPDLTSRIEMLAERLESERDIPRKKALAEAKKQLVGPGPRTLKVYAKVENPAILGGWKETRLSWDWDPDTDTSSGNFQKFADALREEAAKYDDANLDVLEELSTKALEDDLPLREAIAAIKEVAFITDEKGDLVVNEVIRAALEQMGYDGIIDRTVNAKFGTDRDFGKPMAGVGPETTHVLVFDSKQVKSATGNRGTFDPENPDISFMPTMAEYEARKQAPVEIRRRTEGPIGVVPPEGLQLKRRTALPDAVGGEIPLIRYSSRAGEQYADPKNFGKGAATPVDLRGAPKTFWFEEGSPTKADSQVVASQGKTVYGARVDGKGIYDALGEDPLNWAGMVNREKADQLVKDAGYSGVRTKSADGRQVVTLFDLVRQTELGSVNKPQKRAINPGDVSFSPDPQKVAKRVANARVAMIKEKYPEAILPKFIVNKDGTLKLDKKTGLPVPRKVDYAITQTPVAKAAKTPEKAVQAMADKMEAEYREIIKNPEVAAGSTWYSTAREKLGKLLGEDAGFFAQMLGATSARTPVAENFEMSVDAFNRYKAGDYKRQIEGYLEGQRMLQSGELAQKYTEATGKENSNRNVLLDWWVYDRFAAEAEAMPHEELLAKFRAANQKREKKKTEHEQAVDWYATRAGFTPLRSNDKKFNANSTPVLRVLAGTWLEETQGPKTPNFAGNLSGASTKATIDVWAARNLARMGQIDLTKRWRITPDLEKGVEDGDFFFGQAIYEELGQRVGVAPDSLQALFWFAEKHLWEEKGWTSSAGAEKSDFNTLLDITSRTADKLDFTKPTRKERDGEVDMEVDPGDTFQEDQ